MSAKMLQYHTTVDYSLLVNIPPVDYNNLINKPIITNSTNGADGKDGKDGSEFNEIIIWILITWSILLTLYAVIATIYLCKR